MSVKDGGESFDLVQDKKILEITSPQDSVKGPYRIVYKDVTERWVIVTLKWDNKPRLGIRWFWDTCGTPNSFGYSTWFIIPSGLAFAILGTLPLDMEFRKEVMEFLEGSRGE